MLSMNRDCRQQSMARRWVNRSPWEYTSRNLGSGKTQWGEAALSGKTGSRWPSECSTKPCMTRRDGFLVAVYHVAPSLIRVQADEVTYNLHIIICFELELPLLADELPVRELLDAWNQKYREMLGTTPTNDAEGCLKDIHWSAGLVGYFPTYALGNVYAAQLFARARAHLAGLDESLAHVDLGELLPLLRENVHRHGQRYRSVTLIERATEAKHDERSLIAVLRHKYSELYGL